MSAQVLPHDLPAEARVLASILVRPERLVTARDLLRPEDFFRDAHQRIFRACATVWDARTPLGMDTLLAQLQVDGDLERVGGVAYLTSMDRGIPTGDVEAPAAVIRATAQRRTVIVRLQQLLGQAWDTGTETLELLSAIGQTSTSLEQGAALDSFHRGDALVLDAMAAVESLNEGRVGLTTGYDALDRVVGGYTPGQLIVVGARPGMGKSAFITSALTRWVHEGGLHVGLVSLEMSLAEVGMRWLAAEASVDMLRARRRDLREADSYRLGNAAGRLVTSAAARLRVTDVPYLTLPRIRAMARACAAQHGLDLLVIDYLQLVEGDGTGRREESRYEQVSKLSRGLKLLAKELAIPVICLAQLNRQNEQRQNKRPQLADLRDSGSIEQDADIVLFIHRDEVYHPTPENAGQAEFILAKGRNLPLATIPMTYVKQFTRFQGDEEEGAA